MSFLANWNFVKEKKGSYVADLLKEVPTSLVGHAGTIVAVQAPAALYGQPPADQSDSAYVLYGEAIVHLDSGELLQTMVSHQEGTRDSDSFTLLSVREKHKEESARLAEKLKGKSLYFTRLTRLFDLGLPTSSIQTLKAGVGDSQAEIYNFPLLTPMPVLSVSYSDSLDYTAITVQMPSGQKALYILGCVQDELTSEKYACASLSMPAYLTEEEVSAIRKGSLFIGMSEPALYMTMGFPPKSNDSLAGPTQEVYRSAYVYVKDKKVIEVQDHDD